MELVAVVVVTLVLWGLLVLLTPLVWWACLLIALVAAVLGVYVGPELFN